MRHVVGLGEGRGGAGGGGASFSGFLSPAKVEHSTLGESPAMKRARVAATGPKAEFFDDAGLDDGDVALAGKVGSLNGELLAEFESLLAFYASKKTEPWRERQYRKIVAVLKNLPFRITCLEDLNRPQCAVLNGGHTRTRVEEFLRRGKIQLAQNLQNDPRTVAISMLMNFGVQGGKGKYGSYVGTSTAEKWYDSGITTLPQLQHRIESDPTFLTHNQRVMWDFRSDFSQRVPRREVELIADVIAGVFPSSSVVEVMGSYSRGAPDCGDIDLLVTCHGDVGRRCSEAVEALTKAQFITATLRDSHHAPGAHSGQWMGGCRLASLVPARPGFADYTLHRRLDIKVYPPKFRAFAQLYFGSGQEFNRAIRLFATRQGYTLSDQGLRRATRGKNEKGEYGTLWEGPLLEDPSGCNWTTEASIFEFLGLPFIPLEDRDNGIGVARLEAMARAQATKPAAEEDCFIVPTDPRSVVAAANLQRLAPLPSLAEGWRSNGIVALDCEFVGVGRNTSGIGGERNALARASVVSYSGDVLLDTFVKVEEPVTDFRIHVTGLTQANLDQGISFQEARDHVIRLLEGRVVVGHSLAHDFKVLNYHPPAVLLRDTSSCPHLRPGDKGKSLKALSEQHLGVKIQDGTHCSVEDARAALYLYRSVQDLWDPTPPVLGTSAKAEALDKHLTEAAENMAAPVATGHNEPLAQHFDRLAARSHHYAKDHYVRVSRTLRSLPYHLQSPKDLLRPELRCVGRGKAHADIVRMLHEGVNEVNKGA
uniref:RNA exonuclease 4 n=1 Tax=Crypthecodinium cohnii TaxID=2866 RepID=A0A516AGW6_CRYCO|nr:DNA polymerase lambda [Crypthecodinium cohnii]